MALRIRIDSVARTGDQVVVRYALFDDLFPLITIDSTSFNLTLVVGANIAQVRAYLAAQARPIIQDWYNLGTTRRNAEVVDVATALALENAINLTLVF